MDCRVIIEKIESETLSLFACLSTNSKGREVNEKPCDIRTCFQRDRDRILHCKAFRRLKDKTQVYLSPEGDHYRTRLTHTLEVSQIGRTIARALRLNEDLVEAICLGHDLGHTPFGHEGEYSLDKLLKEGFRHYEQSLRVVDVLEKDGKGLNLTWEVRDGILNHSGSNTASTLEGKIVKFADRIAYINHDIDDSIRSKILSEESLPKECIKVLGKSNSERIDTMIKAVISDSENKPEISMQSEIYQAMLELRKFLFENVYNANARSSNERENISYILRNLFEYFKAHNELLPKILTDKIPECGLDRIVCDYIAGMSDTFAIETFKGFFIPKGWT